MIGTWRPAALLAITLLVVTGCTSTDPTPTIRPIGDDGNLPTPKPLPPRILPIANLEADEIKCKVRLQSAHITATIVNNGYKAADPFTFGGTAVNGPDTTQLPDGAPNVVPGGLAAGGGPLEVFLADFPLSGPQSWTITFVVDPPDAQHPGGYIPESNEDDNTLKAVCACVRDPSGAGFNCSIGGGP